jgi:CheY-like chemotaxis protein/HAMP domain-containing protein
MQILKSKENSSGQRKTLYQKIQAGSLGRSLLFWFLFISLTPLLVITFITDKSAQTYFKQRAERELLAICASCVIEIKGYFSDTQVNLEVASRLAGTHDMLENFGLSYEASGLSLSAFVASAEWQNLKKYFQSDMVFLQSSHGYYDLFIIDRDGNILYTVEEEDDLGSNIFTGPYKDTGFAKACRAALEEEQTVFSDFERYAPSNNAPANFMVTVIRDGLGDKKGLLAIQINQIKIDTIMQRKSTPWEAGETYLIGHDLLMRSNSAKEKEPTVLKTSVDTKQTRFWLEEHRIHNPKEHKDSQESHVEHNTAFLYKGRAGNMVLGLHQHFNVLGVPLAVIGEVDEKEAFFFIDKQYRTTVALLLFTIITVIIISVVVSSTIVRPIAGLSRWARKVALGNFAYEEISVPDNEVGELNNNFRIMVDSFRAVTSACESIAIGNLGVNIKQRSKEDRLAQAVNRMVENFRLVVSQAGSIARGDYRTEILPRGDKDELGSALQAMTEVLRITVRENEDKNWFATGLNRLYEQTGGDQDIPTLATNTISFLAKYLNAQVGALYIKKQDDDFLTLAGSYAFTKRKDMNNCFEINEGLVGQAAYEKEIISVANLPDDYFKIRSAIGDAGPRNVVVVPFLFEGKVCGVVEFGTLEEFSDLSLEFLKAVSNPVSVAINAAMAREKMKVLLTQTKTQALALKAQQDELKATNEELEEKTEALIRKKYDIEKKNKDLESAHLDIEKKARDLALSSKYKSEFLANMSHELRTPLNSLLLLASNLSVNKKGNLTDRQVEAASIIHTSGQELLSLISEILDLAKIESGRMEKVLESVNLSEITDTITSSFGHMISEKGLELEITLSKALPESIITDQQRMMQILRNFISNAVKFTEQGRISIEIKQPPADINLSRSGLEPQNAIGFAVIDTGIGIIEEKQKLIFEAFQQVDGTTSRKYGGTGLGLSISRELAKLLGGEIQLSSVIGQGANFTLYLPLEPGANEDQAVYAGNRRQEEGPQQKDSKPPAHLPTPDDDRANIQEGEDVILVIEDDIAFAGILRKQCHDKKYKCLIAPTGEMGLEFAVRYNPAAIILDIKLPGMDGWAVLEHLKRDMNLQHIPVHMMSGENADLEAFKKGVIGFLTKPISTEDLQESFHRIERIINRQISRLLVVEDNDIMRQEMIRLIGNGDVKIDEAKDGEGAFSAIKENTYDCLVLDLGLPDISGFELLDKITADNRIEVPPVVVYTGRELTRDEGIKLRSYTDSIIVKGVRSEERLLAETTLFLHRTVSKMPENQRKIIASLHEQDSMFKEKKILLVDDDMRNSYVLSKILGEKGFTVRLAANGQKALDNLQQEKGIDLVLMDIMMPVMDGYEATRKIREQEQFWNLPIIALTAKAMPEDRKKCLDAGVNDYLPKPLDLDRLLSMLRVWLYK